MLGARGRHDLPHLPLGSVSHRLLHAANRPVLIVPRPRGREAADGCRQAAETADRRRVIIHGPAKTR